MREDFGGTGMRLISAMAGGAFGAAVAGFAEAILVAATGAGAEEYWLFPYAVGSYGLLGATLGVGFDLPFAAKALVTSSPHTPVFARSAGIAFFLIGVVVARYHVLQRIFGEELATWSLEGVAVHVGIVAAVGLVSIGIFVANRRLQSLRFALAWEIAALGVLFTVATAVALIETPSSQRSSIRRPSGTASGHPNVILIIVDTLRADALGVYGGGRTASPAVDLFSAQSVRFADAAAQASWTRPSIATILTSLYPSMHGAVHKMDPLPDAVTTVAEAFRAQGYWTAGFVSNINVAPIFNFQQGFDEFDYLAPSFYFGASDSATRLAIYKFLRVLRERFFANRIYFYNYYQDAAVVNDAALAWLKASPPSPFFLLLHYMDPHDPYFEIPYDGYGIARVTNPDPPHQQRAEMQRLYREEVTYLDGYLDRLFQGLKDLNLFDDSLIVLTADHGEEFLDHGGWWHGTTLYQEVVHVPLIVKRPKEEQPGLVRNDAVRSLDIAPTLVATAGLVPPSAFLGRNVFADPLSASPALFAEEDLEGDQLSSLRTGTWKLVAANADNPRGLPPIELFDLSHDPNEQANLAAAEPARVRAMIEQLNQVRADNMRRAP